jgi:hypothetical protein
MPPAGSGPDEVGQPQLRDPGDLVEGFFKLGFGRAVETLLECGQDLGADLALDRENEGKAELFLVLVVELLETLELRRRALVEPGARLLDGDAAVSSLRIAARPARSGWARIRASCRSRGARRMASTIARCSASRLANGPASKACSATQGACSNKPRNSSTKRSRSSVASTAAVSSGEVMRSGSFSG